MGNSSSKRLRRAAERNDVEEVLQVASSNPSAVLRPSLWKQRTAAHLAARAGSAAALALVLDVAGHAAGGLPTEFLNAPDHAGDTALALAAKHGHADCVRELLEAGASPLPANMQGATALHYAAARGQATCIRLLLSAPVRLPEGGRCRAADALVPDVIDMERFIDTRTHAGLCALHFAVLCGSQAAVGELVGHGAQLDTPLLSLGFRAPALMPACLAAGSTALHMAAATGRAQLCILLLHAQRTRHPGLELRRMRNARGMTPLNVALLCQHRNLASLLTAGSTIPGPLPPLRRTTTGQQALPPLLRQQLLSLVHRAALLGELRQLGLGSSAEGQPLPGLAPAAVARLESLLRSDSTTAGQVLAVVDELLDDASSAGAAGAAGAAAGAAVASTAMGQRSRRRSRRRQEEREAAAQQLVAAQAGVDWTLLDRNRGPLWHAEHGPSAFQRRLQRRRDAQRAAAQAPGAAPVQARAAEAAALAAAAAELPGGPSGGAGGPTPDSSEHALLLAGALLQQAEEDSPAQQAQQAAQQGLQRGASTTSGSQGPSSPSTVSATAGTAEHPDEEALAAATAAEAAAVAEAAGCGACSAVGSQADGSLCPICLDLPADLCIAPCNHRACLTCCGRLVSYCASSSFGLPLAPPLCPLCRGAIETFRKAA